MGQSDPLWIFGYGSLMWRPGFPFVERRLGFVQGFTRRFWQLSTDHRGAPGAPGRVVTLMPEPAEKCWGVGFRVAGAEAAAVIDLLDARESGGYARARVPLHGTSEDGEVVDALTYIADATNPNFGGPAPDDELARQIRAAVGVSGSNVDYLWELEISLRTMNIEDPHVFMLAESLRRLPTP